MEHKKYLPKITKSGFSLIEVIVVVAILGVLGTVLAPQFLRYVEQNRATACRVDREGILAVYERCIYEETIALNTTDLQAMLDDGTTGIDTATRNELKQFAGCPLKNTYGPYIGKVVGDVAIITCQCPDHEDVAVDFASWDLVKYSEGIDEPFTEPPAPPAPPPPEEPSTEEPSTEEPPKDSGVWPYEDHPSWGPNPTTGKVVEIDVPVKFRTREGNIYVLTNRNNTGKYKVEWEDNRGPEYIDVQRGEDLISYSGITITDLSTVQDPTSTTTPKELTGIHYGDIVVLSDGKEYIYGSLSPGERVPYPTPGNTGNFYYVGRDATKE